MRPWSSGNSRTISVVRSALARRAASRAVACACRGQDTLVAQHVDEPRHAFGLLAIGAERLVEGDPGEVVDPIGQAALAVLLVEEGAVAQSGHHHALHAAHDGVLGRAVRVGHRREARDAAVAPSSGMYFWWCTSTVCRTSRGSFWNSAGMVADHHRRILDEVAPFVDERVLVGSVAPWAASPSRMRDRRSAGSRRTKPRRRESEISANERTDSGPPALSLRQESMPVGVRPQPRPPPRRARPARARRW